MKKIKGFRIRLRKREILRALKYDSRTTEITTRIEDKIQDQMEDGYSLIEPSIIYDTVFAKSKQYEIVLEKIVLSSKKISEMLRRARAISCMAVTIGSELEEQIEDIKSNDITAALILDAVGSEAVEQAANFATRLLKEESKKQECFLRERFSPGYSDWSLAASRSILDILGADKIGINLSIDNIMFPRKSITAIHIWKSGRR